MTDGFPALARARNLIQLRRYDAALVALAPALGDPATEAEAWCLQTQGLLAKGDLRRALPSARRAIAARTQDEWPHRLLALVLLRGGNHKGALHAAREAARIAPWQVETLHVLAICQANRRRKAEAQTTANTLLDLHPHSPLAHQTAGAVAMTRGNWTAAEGHLRESLRLEPDQADVTQLLAEVLKRLGRREEAGEMLLAAGRANPTDHTVRKSLGRLGLPASTLGGFGIVKVMLTLQLFRVFALVDPATAVVLLAAFFTLVGGWLSYARVSGTRDLPDEIHRALLGEHRNYALAWLGCAALTSIPLAIWAAAAPQDHGRSLPLALGLAVFSVVALAITLTLWTGPTPNPFASTTARLARRRATRRR